MTRAVRQSISVRILESSLTASALRHALARSGGYYRSTSRSAHDRRGLAKMSPTL